MLYVPNARARSRYECHLDEGGLSIKADALLSDGSKIQMNSKWYAVFQRKELTKKKKNYVLMMTTVTASKRKTTQ